VTSPERLGVKHKERGNGLHTAPGLAGVSQCSREEEKGECHFKTELSLGVKEAFNLRSGRRPVGAETRALCWAALGGLRLTAGR